VNDLTAAKAGGPVPAMPLSPDPTILTREASDRAKEASDKVDTLRDEAMQRELTLRQQQREAEVDNLSRRITSSSKASRRLVKVEHQVIIEKLKADHRVLKLMEAHRLELKSDSEKTLSTATIAAEKAVQAALAAAEKARDQQTIASQLATTKAEDASKERQDQQGETFTTGIAGLSSAFNDVKLQLSELRAERRGGQEQVVVARDAQADMKPIIDAIAELTKAQSATLGAKAQVADSRSSSQLLIAVIGTFMLALALGVSVAALFLGH
jgi:hypothetical protein